MAEIKLTKENFEKEVMQSEMPVLVDFWADWCAHCKTMLPIVEELAGEYDHVKVGKINVDEQPDLAERYKVMTIPTFIVFKNGEAEEKSIGAQSKDALIKMLGEA